MIRSVVWETRSIILLFAVSVLIFSVVFFFYGIPLEAVFYPALLTAVIILLYVGYALYKRRKKHTELMEMTTLPGALMTQFPHSESTLEEDYQNIIHALQKEEMNAENDWNHRYQDMLDYYTTWAHQIKTPIASMRLLLQEEDSDDARRLNEEVMRIEQYVNMVLAFLRLDSTSTDYVFRHFDMDDIIKENIKKLAPQFIRKKIALVYEPIHIQVLSDEKWLSFVIEQILSNALKYTNSGSITITMKDMVLSIKDTGIGIAREDLPRVFEKSYTGYNGRSDKKASGIGLYLCKQIMTKLNHTIEIRSVVNEGTEVLLDLSRKENLTQL